MKKSKKAGKPVLTPDIRVVTDMARDDAAKSWARLKAGLLQRKWTILAVVLGSCFWMALATPKKPDLSPEQAAQCQKDLACLVREFGDSASAGCSKAVELSAKTGIEWEEGVDRWKWSLAPGEGVLFLTGDKALFSDEKGERTRMRYGCRFDTLSKRARLIRLEPAG